MSSFTPIERYGASAQTGVWAADIAGAAAFAAVASVGGQPSPKAIDVVDVIDAGGSAQVIGQVVVQQEPGSTSRQALGLWGSVPVGADDTDKQIAQLEYVDQQLEWLFGENSVAVDTSFQFNRLFEAHFQLEGGALEPHLTRSKL
jgi:hypothetical protein